METHTKKIIESALGSGILLALMMAVYDFSATNSFRPWRFILYFVLFSITIGFSTFYTVKKVNNKSN